jgi:hypothetical protein
MTTCFSNTPFLLTGFRRYVVGLLAACLALILVTTACAQTNATGSQGSTANTPTGNASTNEELFSSSVDDFAAPEGRFTTSRLSEQPTAGGNTNTTQQNLLNNARNLQRLNQQFGRANQNANNSNNQGTRTIRPSLRLGFTPKPRPTEDLRESLGKQLNALTTRLPQLTDGRSEFASVKFDLAQPGEVVLSGTVPNADAGQLLTFILRMEPGVRSVRNDLKVATATSDDSSAK